MLRVSFNTPLVASTVFIAVAAITVLAQLPSLLEALATPRPGADPTQVRLDEFLVGHEDDLATYRDRFDGRSLFIKPAPPRRQAPPPPPPVREDDDDGGPPPPPPPPRAYEGPSIMFVLGDEVWFHDGLRVRVGEKGPNGVTVVASDPPWTVTLGHGGGEYDIVLFDRKHEGLDEKPRARGPMPGLVQVESEEAEPKGPGGDGAERQAP
jgi:hypothetical protein